MQNDDDKGFRYGVITASCDRATTLDEFVASRLASEASAPAASPLDLLELGAVYVNGERSLNPSRPLQPGDGVRIHSAPRRFIPPKDLSSRIISETGDTLLVEKPAGLPAEPTVDNIKENLLSFLEELRGQNLFLTHRLAAESDGLVLIAKSQEARHRIAQAFVSGDIRRHYAAYVETPPARSAQDLFCALSCEALRASTNLITEGRQSWQIEGAPIEVVYRLQIEFTQARPKEIRAEFARLGAPLLGDALNGSRIRLFDPATNKAGIAFRALALSV